MKGLSQAVVMLKGFGAEQYCQKVQADLKCPDPHALFFTCQK